MSGKLLIPVAALASVVLLALPALGLAALPKKGGLYEGTLYANSLTATPKWIAVKVAPNGKAARFTWWCGNRGISARNSITVAIKQDGTFTGTSNLNTLPLWAVKGRFVTATSARASLRIISICDAKGGLVALKVSS